MKFTCGTVDGWIYLGSVPVNLIGTDEGARLCAEIDAKAAEIRASNSKPRTPLQAKLPRRAAA